MHSYEEVTNSKKGLVGAIIEMEKFRDLRAFIWYFHVFLKI